MVREFLLENTGFFIKNRCFPIGFSYKPCGNIIYELCVLLPIRAAVCSRSATQSVREKRGEFYRNSLLFLSRARARVSAHKQRIHIHEPRVHHLTAELCTSTRTLIRYKAVMYTIDEQ